MPNQYTPEKRTVGNLLSLTNPPILVPEWQRSYSWTTSHVETFWNDLLYFSSLYPENNIVEQEYFLGSIVIVNIANSHLLLDGQQRMATSSILLSVIRDFLRRYSQDAATRTQSRYLSDFDDARNEYAYKITLNEYDRDFFKRAILEPRHANYSEPPVQLESHRLILRARHYFEEIFEKKYQEIDNHESSHRWALRIQDVLTNHMSVVAIFSVDEDNASSVFETLNDRGIGLSTPDLVRNLVLRRATAAAREEIVDLWREILEVETDAKLKVFLRHFWISNYGDVKTQSLYREIKRTIVEDNIDSMTLSRAIRDASLLYRDIVSGNHSNQDISCHLNNISELGASQLYPAILSGFLTLNEDNDIIRLLKALICTYVRHSVIGRLENSRMEDVLYKLARDLRNVQDMDASINTLIEFSPNDQAFTNAFKIGVIPRIATARYVLRELEQDRRNTEELDVASPNRVHVEHIYPQTPMEGNRLPNHSRLINRIGNLTLLSRRLNTAIRNSPFDEKKPAYNESEILITNDLVRFDTWNEHSISSRQNQLSERATIIWGFPTND